MKRMRQDEDKTGMDKIKENEAAYNLKEYDSDKSNEEDVSRTVQADLSDAGEQDMTPENTRNSRLLIKNTVQNILYLRLRLYCFPSENLCRLTDWQRHLRWK